MLNLSEENKLLLKNGLLSLAWRTGAFVVVGLLNLVTQLNMSAEVQLVVGLIVGELTKQLRKKFELGKARSGK